VTWRSFLSTKEAEIGVGYSRIVLLNKLALSVSNRD
jgi:hypothetical protein